MGLLGLVLAPVLAPVLLIGGAGLIVVGLPLIQSILPPNILPSLTGS
jgi:hypothetical protein